MKTELKHILPYFEHGLIVQIQKSGYEYMSNPHSDIALFDGIYSFSSDEIILKQHECFDLSMGDIKPIYRHLSDLTNPIKHKGKEFVPIFELAKITEADHLNSNSTLLKVSSVEKKGYYSVSFSSVTTGEIIVFAYTSEQDAFYLKSEVDSRRLIVANVSVLINKLREWMFDLDGLIDSGNAINVNDLEVNCYE